MKKLKKLLCSVLIVCMVLSLFSSVQVQAAARLNKEDVTMYPGDTIKLKVKGSSKKFKWKSSNKAVATVNQKGKVTAKSEGSAIIYAERGYTSLDCWIDVKFNEKEAAENIQITPLLINDRAIAFAKNNNDVDLSVTVSFALCDKYGKIIDTDEDSTYIKSGMTCVLCTDYCNTEDVKNVKASVSDIYNTSYINEQQNIELSEYNVVKDNISVKVANKGNNKYDEVRVTCLFLKNGLPVGCQRESIDNFFINSSKYISFRVPDIIKYYGYDKDEDGEEDWEYVNIDYDQYLIYVDYAICY